VIIFDWDDTLMASSFADRAKLLQTESIGSLPPALQVQFAQLEEHVAKCLRVAAELGNVVIITNAESGWVEVIFLSYFFLSHCLSGGLWLCLTVWRAPLPSLSSQYSSRRFMPRLMPLLEGLRVVSARSTYERFYPGAPLCWKAAAFAHEANQAFGDVDSASSPSGQPHKREIISFGDSNEERTAVKIAAGQLNAVAKSVKFVDLPSPEELSKQVETVCGWLDWICNHDQELDLMLKSSLGDAILLPGSIDGAPVEASSESGSSSSSSSQSSSPTPWRPPPMKELTSMLKATA
jgi:hypothetical protein